MRSILLYALICSQIVIAQHEKPNQVYESFSRAYATLNADVLMDCYTADGTLLNLYDGSSPNSIKSALKIKEYFASFFQRLEGSGKTLKLTFKITDREQVDNVIYDNGYYMLSTISNNEVENSGYGKLSTIIEFVNGSWKFRVDSNTNTDKAEYDNAQVGSIPQPKAE